MYLLETEDAIVSLLQMQNDLDIVTFSDVRQELPSCILDLKSEIANLIKTF